MRSVRVPPSPVARLGAYLVLLLGALGVGAAAGAAFGPEPDGPAPVHDVTTDDHGATTP